MDKIYLGKYHVHKPQKPEGSLSTEL